MSKSQKKKDFVVEGIFHCVEKALDFEHEIWILEFSGPINGFFLFFFLDPFATNTRYGQTTLCLPNPPYMERESELNGRLTFIPAVTEGVSVILFFNFFRDNSALSAIILPFSLARTIPFSFLSTRWMKKPFRRSFTVSWTDRLCCGRLKLECGQLFFFFFFFFFSYEFLPFFLIKSSLLSANDIAFYMEAKLGSGDFFLEFFLAKKNLFSVYEPNW